MLGGATNLSVEKRERERERERKSISWWKALLHRKKIFFWSIESL